MINDFVCAYIADSCQYWLDLEKQEISSPYYPQNYFPVDDDVDCEWIITVPKGNVISLEFYHFDVS